MQVCVSSDHSKISMLVNNQHWYQMLIANQQHSFTKGYMHLIMFQIIEKAIVRFLICKTYDGVG